MNERSHTVVIGAGASGLAAAALVRSEGGAVVVNDRRSRAELGRRAEELEALGVTLVLGAHDASVLEGATRVVVSPGVPPLPMLDEARARGIEVIAEVELAARSLRAPIVAITGTNGKSTVTTLIGAMLERSGFATFLGGNLGDALSCAVGSDADTPHGRVVVELSSFQLERIEVLRPRVAVLLNVTPDHLDRYPNLEAYGRAKARIFAAQADGDHAIVPADDPVCAALAPTQPGVTRHTFGGASGEVRVEGTTLRDTTTGMTLPIHELRLAGRHNQDNAAAAALAARLAGASEEAILRTLRAMSGLPHRAQEVRELEGVRYVDDSKATNVGAAVAALDGLASPARRAVMILGGVDKGGSYVPLRERLARVGRAAVLIGEATPLIEAALEGLALPITRASTMEDAVDRARAHASAGDIVLLAPACSSFDMYKSYAHRGDVFAAAVRALTPEETR